ALWYQPHFHSGAFFETRSTIRLIPEEQVLREPEPVAAAPAPQPQPAASLPATVPSAANVPSVDVAVGQQLAGDPVVAQVQRLLADMNLYAGDVDGLAGPQTGRAIASYRRIVGLG